MVSSPLPQYALIEFLRQRNPLYYGKASELRLEIEGWLAYTLATFPHYTRHTLRHSEEIISQLSQLLFYGASVAKPVLPDLSAVEAYILVCAAYLHDAGMVVSDTEKVNILTSTEWKDWVQSGSGAKRFEEVEAFRLRPGDATANNFWADVHLRYLIAEFVRRRHHLRAGRLVDAHGALFQKYALGDAILQRSLANVCVGHGLTHAQLEDDHNYPDRQSILGEQANIRLLAILLRLGDLLDMSADRACPILLNAANPIPKDSYAHWTQYQAITDRLTDPSLIRIRAECPDQDVHRVFSDWCEWICAESANARRLLAKSQRHQEWSPPVATMEGPDPTITIQPAPSADYVWTQWQFTLDAEEIFNRLIYNASGSRRAFIRELLQNALDATRCKVYHDLMTEGADAPESPTSLPSEVLERYPVKLKVESRSFHNEMSQEDEQEQVLTIQDFGIGMDREIVERYFLQIGRSFYVSDEFRRAFHFIPSSRFGLGFLSVFAESNRVTVDTYKPSASAAAPLRLTLTGPRSYLLTNRSTRNVAGTQIEVVLNTPLDEYELFILVNDWCQKVEFPIEVESFGRKLTFRANPAKEFERQHSDPVNPECTYRLAAFPVEGFGLEGDIYIFLYETPEYTSWADYSTYLEKMINHPSVSPIKLPDNWIGMNGITVKTSSPQSGALYTYIVDFRRATTHVGLDRSSIDAELADIINEQIIRLVNLHLKEIQFDSQDAEWKYRERLAEHFAFPVIYDESSMLPIYSGAVRQFVRMQDLQQYDSIYTLLYRWSSLETSESYPDKYDAARPIIRQEDLRICWQGTIDKLLESRFIKSIARDGNFDLVEWVRGPSDTAHRQGFLHLECAPVEGDQPHVFARVQLTDNTYPISVLNTLTPFGAWLVKALKASANREKPLTREHYRRLLNWIEKNSIVAEKDAVVFLDNWREIPGLEEGLYPPPVQASGYLGLISEA